MTPWGLKNPVTGQVTIADHAIINCSPGFIFENRVCQVLAAPIPLDTRNFSETVRVKLVFLPYNHDIAKIIPQIETLLSGS